MFRGNAFKGQFGPRVRRLDPSHLRGGNHVWRDNETCTS